MTNKKAFKFPSQCFLLHRYPEVPQYLFTKSQIPGSYLLTWAMPNLISWGAECPFVPSGRLLWPTQPNSSWAAQWWERLCSALTKPFSINVGEVLVTKKLIFWQCEPLNMHVLIKSFYNWPCSNVGITFSSNEGIIRKICALATFHPILEIRLKSSIIFSSPYSLSPIVLYIHSWSHETHNYCLIFATLPDKL